MRYSCGFATSLAIIIRYSMLINSEKSSSEMRKDDEKSEFSPFEYGEYHRFMPSWFTRITQQIASSP